MGAISVWVTYVMPRMQLQYWIQFAFKISYSIRYTLHLKSILFKKTTTITYFQNMGCISLFQQVSEKTGSQPHYISTSLRRCYELIWSEGYSDNLLYTLPATSICSFFLLTSCFSLSTSASRFSTDPSLSTTLLHKS